MPPAVSPGLHVSPQAQMAFEDGCRDVFPGPVQPPWRESETAQVLWRFAGHYQRLSALPRRVRRALARECKRSLGAVALLMTLGQAPALAATLLVAPATPPAIKADGKCSLGEAIVNANRNARAHLDCVSGSGVDTIVLPPASQQRLGAAQALPKITSPIVIEGRRSTVSRTAYSRLDFFVVTAAGSLTLNETVITGATTTPASSGYAVANAGRLALNHSTVTRTGGLSNTGGAATVTDSRVTDNQAPYVYSGGGIRNRGGASLTLTNSVVTGNGAQFRGAGIFNDAGSTATLIDSVVSGNSISYEGSGGGIYNRGTLVLFGTTVAGNAAHSGAGILNYGTATVRRSTISGNVLFSDYDYLSGGGVLNLGKLTLVNSTVSGNEARAYGGGIASGNDGTLAILASTVTGNSLAAGPGYDQSGGGVFVRSGTLTLERSIISGNGGRTVREIAVEPGVVVTANDFNLFGHDGDAGVAGFTIGSTDVVPTETIGGILRPLADNGGRTHTHALSIGSPALDASPDDAGCPTVDQRDSHRPRGPACDIGSFEGSAVLCNGRVTTMVGTDGPDELNGTVGPDVIAGLNGNDTIAGLDGNDLVCAGGGGDIVFGGSGNDVLLGQGGNDQLFGHRGEDTLHGGAGQDRCDGGVHAGAGDTATACESVQNVP